MSLLPGSTGQRRKLWVNACQDALGHSARRNVCRQVGTGTDSSNGFGIDRSTTDAGKVAMQRMEDYGVVSIFWQYFVCIVFNYTYV
jgi:hypothetical protein